MLCRGPPQGPHRSRRWAAQARLSRRWATAQATGSPPNSRPPPLRQRKGAGAGRAPGRTMLAISDAASHRSPVCSRPPTPPPYLVSVLHPLIFLLVCPSSSKSIVPAPSSRGSTFRVAGESLGRTLLAAPSVARSLAFLEAQSVQSQGSLFLASRFRPESELDLPCLPTGICV